MWIATPKLLSLKAERVASKWLYLTRVAACHTGWKHQWATCSALNKGRLLLASDKVLMRLAYLVTEEPG